LTTSDAKSTDAQKSEAQKRGAVAEIIDTAKTIVFALLIVLVMKTLLFQPYTIPSASMEPNLYEGDYIIVSKFDYGYSRHSMIFSPPLFDGRIFNHAPTRGDVVVFKLPREVDGHVDYIKRLIGLPGDHIQVKGGLVYINGRPVVRKPMPAGTEDMGGGVMGPVARFQETLPNGKTYLTNSYGPDGGADNTGVYVVPPHCYFMMGDNRDNSLDSRFDPAMPLSAAGPATCGWDSALDSYVSSEAGVGFVPEQDLVGKARIILLSWTPGASLFKPWTWVANLRPSRFFHSLH
jgi:signal peptidase I